MAFVLSINLPKKAENSAKSEVPSQEKSPQPTQKTSPKPMPENSSRKEKSKLANSSQAQTPWEQKAI